MIEITMLGTSCMVPTKERNVSGIYAEIKGKGILFDCGEGTQRQMNIANINRNKVQYIFISHWHADHIAGLLGLIQTVKNASDQSMKLFGPPGTKEHFGHLMKASVWDYKADIEVKEFDCKKIKTIFKCDEFRVEAINLKHSTHTLGFSLIESDKRKMILSKIKKEGIPEGPMLADLQKGIDIKHKGKTLKSKDYTNLVPGKKMTYVSDTMFTKNAITLAEDCDLIITESTYTSKHVEKADDHMHLTSEQAAQIASMSNSEKLILTHLSQRYKTPEEILDNAKDVFPNTEIAFDFMKIKLK